MEKGAGKTWEWDRKMKGDGEEGGRWVGRRTMDGKGEDKYERGRRKANK